ncbi:MAG: hypothetical protein KGR23_11915 [Betaproteobacteria bacterium]|nr:hypothetical protein [Betaproteobacteria bacterium]
MSVITEILDRLSGIEVVKEKLQDNGHRVERLAERVVELHRSVHDIDRRLVRIEARAEIARTARASASEAGRLTPETAGNGVRAVLRR